MLSIISFYSLVSWFISLPQFLSCRYKDLKWWTNYSSSRQDFTTLVLSCGLKQWVVTAQASKTLLNRQQIVLTDPEGVTLIPLGLPFCTCCLILWFNVIQNGAGTCTKQEGMKMVICSRAIREGGVFSWQRFSLWSSASFFSVCPPPPAWCF